MKILLSAFSCDPELGSEERNGWNLAVNLVGLGHQVWVLTHPQGKKIVERVLRETPIPNLHMEFVNQSKWASRFIKGESDWKYLYIIWQRMAYKTAIKLDKEIDFDIVHHVTWGSLKGGSPLWRLKKPFVFGSVGGCQVAPKAFKQYFMDAWSKEAIRSFFTTKLLRYIPMAYNTVRRAELVLATNRETMDMVKRMGAKRLEYFRDCGLPDNYIPTSLPQRPTHDGMTLIWVGSLFPNKALNLTLEALAIVNPKLPVRLKIVGSGPLDNLLPKWIQRLGIQNRVEHLGRIDWLEVREVMLDSDALIFTSLRDSCPVQLLEAMAQGLPIITLNHQGARDLVPDEAGIKVAVTSPLETVQKIAEGIEYLYNNPEKRQEMGVVGWKRAKQETWTIRAIKISQFYNEVLAA